ncbi:hypothetical protein [Martelella radicis]|uniref:Uncharacterized protein n=1 Tax=Martelella radicis TaxID=1397476 RepID=A0A7W6PBM3_9HYPH|nr:hypothetical protein [Martelella radicis]MBB4123596.1 hypothetical protein [Martelella radicis]
MANQKYDDIPRILAEYNDIMRVLVERLDTPQTRKTLDALLDEIRGVVNAITPLAVFSAKFDQTMQLNEKIVQIGWMPHPVFPLDTLDLHLQDSELDALLARYVEENFEAIECFFIESATKYGITDTVPMVMTEALNCHCHNNYRAVVRLLFPEIESAARTVFRYPIQKGIASIPDVREIIGKLSFPMVFDHPGTFSIYDKLNEHMYRQVKSSLELTAAQADPVPNRHAAIHGLVDYSSMQNSMNTIIMADFIFRLLGEISKMPRKNGN